MTKYLPAFFLLSLALSACDDTSQPEDINDHELITTVELVFTPTQGDALLYRWADPENDGSPVIDDIELVQGETYELSVAFLNELEDPAEDITEEVRAEGDEHQVFLTGSAVEAVPALLSYTYADEDTQGYPLGLLHEVTAEAMGEAELVLTLRHLPTEGGEAVKTGTLAEEVESGGLGSIPGGTDAQVSFMVMVGM